MAETINTFQEGLMMDAHPLTVPNTCLTNALNASIITFNGNEFVLQNDMGNGKVETAYLPAGYIPVGVKEYGGIIYIASYNPIKNQSQLGCFPSPERLISSDEVGLPKVNLTDTNFGLIENGTEGATSEYLKLEVFEPTQIFNPGDQFMIAIKHNDGAELNEVLSHYGKLEDGTIKGVQDITLSLAILDEVGNVTTIEDSLIKDPTTGYWMPPFNNSDITDLQNPEEFRKSIGGVDKYNIYKSKISGHLVLIVRLEGMKNFDFTRKVSILNKGITPDKDSFIVSFTGSSKKYTEKNSVNYKGYEFKYELYEEGIDAPIKKGNIFRVDENSDHLKDDIIKLSLDASLEGFESVIGQGFNRKHILKYEVIPFTDFLYLERFKKTGIIDFSKIGSGQHSLTEWRYFVDNNNLTSSFGFDYNPLDGFNLQEVYFELYDIVADYSVIVPITNKDDWSGNFTETIEFLNNNFDSLENYLKSNNNVIKKDNKYVKLPKSKNYLNSSYPQLKINNFYIARICMVESYESEGETKYENTNFYKYMYTTPIFNKNYLDNEEQDFQNIIIKPFLEININRQPKSKRLNNVNITDNIFKRLEIGDNPGDLIYNNTTANIEFEESLDLLVELLESDNYFGNFNKNCLDIEFKDNYNIKYSTNYSDKDIVYSGSASDEMINALNDINDLNKLTDLSLTKHNKNKISLKLKGILGRLLISNTIEDSIKYSGSRLESFMPEEIFTESYPLGEDMDYKIGGLAKNGKNIYFKKVIGIEKTEMCVMPDLANKRQLGQIYKDYVEPPFFNASVRNMVADGHFKDPLVYLVTGYDNKYASLRIRHNRSGQYQYHKVNEFDKDGDYNFIIWKTIESAGVDQYVFLNMITKGNDVDNTYKYKGRVDNLGTTIVKILSNFYLVQKGNFEDDILVINDFIYNTDFNTIFKVVVEYINNNRIIEPIFSISNINNLNINFNKGENGLNNYLQKVLNINQFENIVNLNQNNLPSMNCSDIHIIQPKEFYLDYEAGNELKFTQLLKNLIDPENYAVRKSSNIILDSNGRDVDDNNQKYSPYIVYIKNPTIASSSSGTSNRTVNGIYPINKIKGNIHDRGVYLKNVHNRVFFCMSSKYSNFLVASYSLNESGINMPLMGNIKSNRGNAEVTDWQQKSDKDTFPINSDLTFVDTYHAINITDRHARVHGNTII